MAWRQFSKLYTPGPINTSLRVKQAMLKDYGSRDSTFLQAVKFCKDKVLEVAKLNPKDYACILVQGSGTFAVEATIQQCFAKGKMLCVSNGAYGDRIKKICDYYRIPNHIIRYQETELFKIDEVLKFVDQNRDITHVSAVHSETTAGLLNPAQELGTQLKKSFPNVKYIVDAISSFGGVPYNIAASKTDWLVSSCNKMFQGVPGLAFVLCEKSTLEQSKGNARSLVLDLYDQWKYAEGNQGQFRFTPPTHVIMAFQEALKEFEEEGGIEKRNARYVRNQNIIYDELEALGFKFLVARSDRSPVISTISTPKHPNFNFQKFYDLLKDDGYVIYPGKLTAADSFRIGSIGDLYPDDFYRLIKCIQKVFAKMQIPLPL